MKLYEHKSSYLLLLRVISAIIIICIVLAMFFAYNVSRPAYQTMEISINNAHLDVSNLHLDESPPLYLNGEWQFFPEVFFDTSHLDNSLFSTPQKIKLPIKDIKTAQKKASYRFFIALGDIPKDGLVFYIPNPKNDMNVFLNGKMLNSSTLNQNWLNYSIYDSVFYLNGFDSNKKYQEILVSTSNDVDASAGIFRRPLAISTLRNIITLSLISVGNEMLIIGAIFIMLISSYIFMLFRPSHKMITAMTLFDSFLMMRIIFSLNNVFGLTSNMLGRELLSDKFCYSMQIFCLFMAGISGMKLSHDLYDPDNKTPKILTTPAKVLYMFFGIFFLFHVDLFDKIGVPILIFIFIYTFIGVTYQFIICIKRGCSVYFALQISKTIYIGIVIFFDIYFWSCQPDFLLMVLLYCLFFTIHIGFRLYDNNISYCQVEVFNRNLERTIEERTQALEESNRQLEEISIRDPLTKAYNRRYFERILKNYIELHEKNGYELYLALFDLDLFKRVNDTYGHDEGDKQLIAAVECCNKVTGDMGILSRIGGEEFTVLFLDKDEKTVLDWAQSLRLEFEKAKEIDPKKTTVSIGLTKYQGGFDEATFYKASDNCLYHAKNTGRNKVCHDFNQNILEDYLKSNATSIV